MNHPDNVGEQDESDDIAYVSKSQIKKEMHELRDMGARLQELKPVHLEKLDLTERLRTALEEGRRIRHFNARKRHLNFIGKLMRDQDVEPIRELLQRLDSQTQESAFRFHQLERWRERLLTEGNAALTEYMNEYPQADSQHIRHLVRNALKEKNLEEQSLKEQKECQPPTPTRSRKLFRYLREVSENRSAPVQEPLIRS